VQLVLGYIEVWILAAVRLLEYSHTISYLLYCVILSSSVLVHYLFLTVLCDHLQFSTRAQSLTYCSVWSSPVHYSCSVCYLLYCVIISSSVLVLYLLLTVLCDHLLFTTRALSLTYCIVWSSPVQYSRSISYALSLTFVLCDHLQFATRALSLTYCIVWSSQIQYCDWLWTKIPLWTS